jgi:hypothetical protein
MTVTGGHAYFIGRNDPQSLQQSVGSPKGAEGPVPTMLKTGLVAET